MKAWKEITRQMADLMGVDPCSECDGDRVVPTGRMRTRKGRRQMEMGPCPACSDVRAERVDEHTTHFHVRVPKVAPGGDR